ncbi:hypothetical protein cce_0845 [Crocosphaera subtropica ATCC 51142]|uniref:Uncharacterized protein n=1 Tax=Crocosphaera subtropica (strain ATCC 51142 / BH68) TaxID=43989 RepID=B1WS02_CROS5|nr:hypothetical protein cce_0845 [Crocosphaera subtropica ATCC 51142]
MLTLLSLLVRRARYQYEKIRKITLTQKEIVTLILR